MTAGCPFYSASPPAPPLPPESGDPFIAAGAVLDLERAKIDRHNRFNLVTLDRSLIRRIFISSDLKRNDNWAINDHVEQRHAFFDDSVWAKEALGGIRKIYDKWFDDKRYHWHAGIIDENCRVTHDGR